MSTDDTDHDDPELLRPDAVAPVDEPEQRLYPDAGPDEPDTTSPYPDGAGDASPYPDGAGDASPYPDGSGGGAPYPDGWGASAAGGQYVGTSQGRIGRGGGPPVAPPPMIDAYPQAVAQYDPAIEFEPPQDLPPWYEDEYYDDRDWEPLPRSTSTWFRVLIFLGVLVVLVFITGNFIKGWVDEQLDPPGEEGAVLVINIPQGASTNDIVRILEDQDVVANGTVFRYYLQFKDAGDWQAGEYTLRTNMAVWDVREILDEGPAPEPDTRLFVTIPEGLTVDETQQAILAQVPTFDAVEMSDAVLGARTPTTLGDAVLVNAEGWLFPETYDIDDSTNTNEQAFLNRMVDQFDVVASNVGLDAPPPELGVTPYQALIIASLIEEEAKVDQDRAKIARVIYNRLEAGWNLGIDATVVYALGGDRELSASDLAFDSPYNTRLYTGLPPTPIAAPGAASLEAALNPADGPWMYYVLTDEDGPGTHTFAETEAEFEVARQICIERELGCG